MPNPPAEPATDPASRVVVIGLGPAGADLLTQRARNALTRIPEANRFCRTARHPAVTDLGREGITMTSFDEIYDEAETIEAVYAAIVDALVGAAAAGTVAYAVPGSAAVGETSVALLRETAEARGVAVELIPGISFIDAAALAVGIDPIADSLQIIDAERLSEQPLAGGPLLIAQCHDRLLISDAKLTLLEELEPDHEIAVITDAGDAAERVDWIPLAEIDASDVVLTPRTTLFVPANPKRASLRAFVDLVEVLRSPGGCPWDAKQTHQSLTRHLLEETYEVLEAIEALGSEAPGGEVDPAAYSKLEEELGDLLFQVAFHATLAKEAGAFTFADVARGIHDKLVHRHPHVFGDVVVDGPDAVVRNWEQIKAAEKERESLMDDIPGVLPALAYAGKMQRRAASVGFDWDSIEPVLEKVHEELGELETAISDASDTHPNAEIEAELGDVLFAAVNLARKLNVDPEASLRGSSARFASRFRIVESLAEQRSLDLASMSLESLDELWEEAKALSLDPPPG